MAAPPAVSVLLPVRDGAGTIGRAIASIQRQTWRDWELIVVDDGSADETPAIVEAFGREDARVRLVRRAPGGIVAALNTGLVAARGELIARMDADDESAPERFAEQVAFLSSPGQREIGLVGCLVEFGGDRAASAGYALHVDWVNSLVTPEEIALNRFVESPFAHPSVMFRRSLVASHGGYREGNFPEDYELWLRWLDAGVRMAKVPRALLRWNDPPGRLSRTDPRYDRDAFFRVKAEWIARWLVAERGSISPDRGAAGETCAGLVKRRSETLTLAATHGGETPTPSAPRRILVWGAGRPTRKRAAALETHGLKIAGYIDVDARKTTRALGGTGLPVVAVADVPPPTDVFVLGYVSSRGARAFIRAELTARGYVEGRDFLMCA